MYWYREFHPRVRDDIYVEWTMRRWAFGFHVDHSELIASIGPLGVHWSWRG